MTLAINTAAHDQQYLSLGCWDCLAWDDGTAAYYAAIHKQIRNKTIATDWAEICEHPAVYRGYSRPSHMNVELSSTHNDNLTQKCLLKMSPKKN